MSAYPGAAVTISGSSSFCVGGSTTLDAGGGFTNYIWSTNEMTSSISVNSPGLVFVTITDINGCTATGSVDVTEQTSLSPNIGGDLTLCPGDQVTLDAGSGFETYLWSDTSTDQSLAVSTPGEYTVQVSDADGCTGSSTVEVVEVTPEPIDLPSSVTICAGTTVDLEVDPLLFVSYNWSNGLMSNSINVPAGIYSVDATDINGCTVSASVEVVEEQPIAEAISTMFNVCNTTTQGSSTMVDLFDLITGDVSGSWTALDGAVSVDQGGVVDFDGIAPGVYAFSYSIDNPSGSLCVTFAFTVPVTVNDCNCPSLEISSNFEICNSESFDLQNLVIAADPGGWSFVDGPQQLTVNNATLETIDAPAGSYTLRYTLDDPQDNCDAFQEVTLEIVEQNNAGQPVAVNFCADQNLVIDLLDLIDEADNNGQWEETGVNPGAILMGSGSDVSVNIQDLSVGANEFTYTIERNGPCPPASNIVIINVNESPVASAGSDIDILCNQPVQVIGQGSGQNNTSASWSLEGDSDVLSSQNSIDISIGGSYVLSITDQITGCVARDTIVATELESSSMSELNQQLCDNESIQIGTTIFDINNPQGQVTLSGANVDGCDSIVNVNLELLSSSTIDLVETLCTGDDIEINGVLYNEDNTSGTVLLVNENGCDSIINVEIEYELELLGEDDFFFAIGPGLVSLDILDNDEFSSFQNITVNVLESSLVVDPIITEELMLNFTVPTQVTGEGYIDYELCDNACDLGCLRIRVHITIPALQDYDDEVLSPNGDGVNDKLVVQGFEENEVIEGSFIQVFNRWGQIVFQESSYGNNWTGYYNNASTKPVPEGTYYYYFRTPDGQARVGSRLVIR